MQNAHVSETVTCTGNKLTQFKYENQITLSCKLVDIKLLNTVGLLVTQAVQRTMVKNKEQTRNRRHEKLGIY